MPTDDAQYQTPIFSSESAPRRRKRRWVRILLWSAVGLVILVSLAACAGVVWLRAAEKTALPVLDGEVHLAGLSAPVTVERDAHGVPHIAAANQDDLFVAQGYVTAQDRLWQMDVFRRNAQGTLAEIMGASMVRHDKFKRNLKFLLTAQRIYANLPPADRARLDDYARGVNLFIAQHGDSLPAEFRLLSYRPEPWSGVDSISIGLMMVDMLDTHWYVKLFRERITSRLNNPKLEADLYPVGSWRDHPPTGEVIDLTQPHPAPPVSEDEDDDRTQAGAGAFEFNGRQVALKEQSSNRHAKSAVLKGHGFSRAVSGLEENVGFSPRGGVYHSKDLPSGAKAQVDFAAATARLKSCLFKATAVPMARPKSGSFKESAASSTLLKSRPFKTDDRVSSEELREFRYLLGIPDCAECDPGSNNWVIAGRHTASGKPLLSNDMHLGLTEPNVWFMADLRAPGFHAAGVTLPGMPFVIAGHNEHVAWGITALYADVQDLYVEKLDGKGNYRSIDTSWKPLEVDHETIHVRLGKDVTFDVQSTEHGPLIDPIFTKGAPPTALKWTLYDTTLNALPLYEMNTASNWAEFSSALNKWNWPTQNVVYSDDQGHIGYHAVGRIPQRPAGLQVTPIRDATHEWQGYIPFDQMPNAFDPPSGFLATANSRVTSDKFPALLTLEWADPYRIERIYKQLDGRDGLTPGDMLALQTDVYSEVNQELGHRFAYAIDHTPDADAQLKKAADLMRSWDGRLTTDSAAASIVTQARDALWPLILKPKVGENADFYQWAESNFAEEEIIMHANPDWLPAGYKNWDALLTEAVRQGMKHGKAPADGSQWSYGSWHVVDIQHPLADFLPFIGRVAGTGEQPLSGDTTTVKQVGRDFGPSQRFTMDWSNIDGSTENIVLGESSNPYSPYFRDQWNDYYNGTTFALPFSPAAVSAQTRHTLRLLP